jgi:hypothetical protein
MYNTLDTKKTNLLNVVRRGWLSPEYDLTDGNYSYGKMKYTGIFKRKPVAETATEQWRFVFEGFTRRSFIILDKNGVQIGKLSREMFSRTSYLVMATGFTAQFRPTSLFSRTSVWEADGYGTIMHINNPFFAARYPVTIAQSAAPQAVMPLLIFLGVHRIIVDQQKKAMAASHKILQKKWKIYTTYEALKN